MSAYNNVNLIGRLTKEIDVRKTMGGKDVTMFTLAVRKDKEKSDFVQCVAWGETAKLMSTYLRKGSLIGVNGVLSTRSYDDNAGKRHWITEVVVNNLAFLESKTARTGASVEPTQTWDVPADDPLDMGQELPF